MVKLCDYKLKLTLISLIDSFYSSGMFGSSAGLVVSGFIDCTGSEQKLYECLSITEQIICSHAVVNCQPGMRNPLRLNEH